MNGSFDIRQQLTAILEGLVESVTAAAPRVLGGIVIILLAWLGAKLIARILRSVLTRVKFDSLVERMGLDKMMQKVGITVPASAFLPRVVYFLLLFLFGQVIVDSMGLTAISGAIGSFLAYLPNVVAALLVLILGSLLGQYAGAMVKRTAEESGIDFASTLGAVVSAITLLIAAIMAVSQLKIDTDIVRIVSVCLLAGLALAFGLSFGLGSREFTRNILAGFYAKKLFTPGDEVEVDGQRGVISAMTPVQIVIESDDRSTAVANTSFMEKATKKR